LAAGAFSLVAFAAGLAAGFAAASAVLNPFPLAVLGGLLVLGLGATYMAQLSETEASILQTENQARQNAKCFASSKKGKEQEPEYEQNCRDDGRKWQEVFVNRNNGIERLR